MLGSHVILPGDVFMKFLIGSSVCADQFVVTVTDTDLCHCSLKNCRLVIIRVQYRVIVVIIQQMVIIRYTGKVFIITQHEGFTGKWLHLWFVISKKTFHL